MTNKFLALAIIVVSTTSPAQTPNTPPITIQQGNNWCWAASVVSILSAYGITTSQQALANQEVNGLDEGATIEQTADAVTVFGGGFVKADPAILRSLFLGEVNTRLANHRPFIIGLVHNSDGSDYHAVVASAKASATAIAIMDPDNHLGGAVNVEYSALTTDANYRGYAAHWGSTATIFRTPTAPSNISVIEISDSSACTTYVGWTGTTPNLPEAYSYQIERQVNGGTWQVAKTSMGTTGVLSAGSVPLADSDIASCSQGTALRYRLKQFNVTGDGPDYSSTYVTSDQFTIPVTPILAAANNGEAIHLSWTALSPQFTSANYQLDGESTWHWLTTVVGTPAEADINALPEFQPYKYSTINTYTPNTTTTFTSFRSNSVLINRFAAWLVPLL